MTLKIYLRGMWFFAYHGVLESEQEQGQNFIVDVVLDHSQRRPVDDLNSTIDYSAVYDRVQQVIQGPPRQLIETVAEEIADEIISHFPCRQVTVTVTKPDAPLNGPLQGAAVEVSRCRDESSQPWWPVEGYIALGSNLGDRQANLWLALGQIASHPRICLRRVSSFYETRPVGPVEQANFFNAVAMLQTDLPPQSLLAFLQQVEQNLGRVREVHWGPRTIDLDILLYGSQQLTLPDLIIPHPYLYQRDFVIFPLAEIAPRLVHPDGRTTMEILEEFKSQPSNRLCKFPGHVRIERQ